MQVRMRKYFDRVRRALGLGLCVPLLWLVALPTVLGAQIPRNWTEIDARGTAVDWSSLEQQETPTEQAVALIWARAVEHEDTIVVQVAVRCAPTHAAVVTVQRPRPGGRVEVSGPVALADLKWQDPPAMSYLRPVVRAVCARTRDERGRPC